MNEPGLVKSAATLLIITLVSGFFLGGVYQLTRKPIELATITASNKTYKAVFAEAETFDPGETLTTAIPVCNETLADMNFGGAEVENVLKAMDTGSSQLGYAITSLSNDSRGGVVKLSVRLEDDGTITGIEFLEISDIPGPGLEAKEPAFKDQYTGKNAPELSVTKSGSADDAQINAIDGTTIASSTATNVVDAALYYLHDRIQ